MLALRVGLPAYTSLTAIRLYATASSSKKKPKIDPNALPLAQAIDVIKSAEARTPQSFIQLSIRCNLEGTTAKLRSTIALPRPIFKSEKKENRVLVFAEGEKAEEALRAGASIVGGKELVEQIQNGEVEYNRNIRTPEGRLLQFDKVISTTDMFTQVIKAAKILASIQRMPQAKRGTVTNDIEKAVKFQIREGCDIVSDNDGNVSAVVGNVDFSHKDIEANVKAVLEEVRAYGEAQRIKKVLGKVMLHGGHTHAIPIIDASRI